MASSTRLWASSLAMSGHGSPTLVAVQAPLRPICVAELVDRGLLEPGEQLVMQRRDGTVLTATVREDGMIELPSGSVHFSPPSAADAATGVKGTHGWERWYVPRLRESLNGLRWRIWNGDVTSWGTPDPILG